MTLQKSNIIPLIDLAFRSNPQYLSAGKMDVIVELVSNLTASQSLTKEILDTFGLKTFLLHCASPYEGLQKASLKVVKGVNEFEFGKKAFEVAEGSKILSEVLSGLLSSNS